MSLRPAVYIQTYYLKIQIISRFNSYIEKGFSLTLYVGRVVYTLVWRSYQCTLNTFSNFRTTSSSSLAPDYNIITATPADDLLTRFELPLFHVRRQHYDFVMLYLFTNGLLDFLELIGRINSLVSRGARFRIFPQGCAVPVASHTTGLSKHLRTVGQAAATRVNSFGESPSTLKRKLCVVRLFDFKMLCL